MGKLKRIAPLVGQQPSAQIWVQRVITPPPRFPIRLSETFPARVRKSGNQPGVSAGDTHTRAVVGYPITARVDATATSDALPFPLTSATARLVEAIRCSAASVKTDKPSSGL